MDRIWKFKKPDDIDEDVIKEVLRRRGLSPEDFPAFEKLDLSDLFSPFVYTDMKKAAERLIKAGKTGEKVLIYGDYDVDGVTSSVLLTEYLKDILQVDAVYYLPDRFRDGYGLNIQSLKKLGIKDFDLLITVDCGIKAHEEIDFVCEKGVDVIVTDHHRPGKFFPGAMAVLNPSCREKVKPEAFKELNHAGVGVVFRLCQAVQEILGNDPHSNYLITRLSLVALGSVADVVPLQRENRIFVGRGLKEIEDSKRPGLVSLKKEMGLNSSKRISAGRIGFILAPPLNAAGRLRSPDLSFQLLYTSSKKRARILAGELSDLNDKRKMLQEKILNQAEKKIEEKDENDVGPGIILASEQWHEGVIGIVASRLVEKYNYPVILISLKRERGKGSARSIPGLDLFEVISSCKDTLESYGGHKMAAGLSIKRENIDDFQKKFNSYLQENIPSKTFLPEKRVDAILPGEEDIDRCLVNEIKELRPFGVGNPEPIFLFSGVELNRVRKVGSSGEHLKIKTSSGLSGIGFALGYKEDMVKKNISDQTFRLLVRPKINKWRGKETLEVQFMDIIPENLSHLAPLLLQDEDVLIFDARNSDKNRYLSSLKKWPETTLIYLNSVSVKERLEGKFPGMKFITSMPDQGNLGGRIVFWDPPFSLYEISRFMEVLKQELNPPEIHLIFGDKDLDLNKKIIDRNLPLKEDILRVCRWIENQDVSFLQQEPPEELNYSSRCWQEILKVLMDSGILDLEDEEYIPLENSEVEEMDLFSSLRFREISEIRSDFSEMIEAFSHSHPGILLEKIKSFSNH